MTLSASQIVEKITRHVSENSERYFGHVAQRVEVTGLKDVDYWSIIQTYRVLTEHNQAHTVFCKMPKGRWELDSPEKLSHDPAAAAMARTEHDSLVRLAGIFAKADPALRVVRPLDLLHDPNAIVTEGVPDATEVYLCLRSADRGQHSREAALDMVHKCGRWLGHLHGHDAEEAGTHGMPDFRGQLADLRKDVNRSSSHAGRLLPYLAQADSLSVRSEDRLTLTAEGFEVRNFIVSKGTIYFLDPGKLWLASPYEDLARFLASLSVLYWGKLKLLWKSPTEDFYARAFLSGYESAGRTYCPELLKGYLVKQYLKLWLEGLRVLDFKPYPRPLKWVGRRFYLPAFFCKRIEQEFGSLRQAI